LSRPEEPSATALLEQIPAGADSRHERIVVAESGLLLQMSHEIRTPMNGLLGALELLDHPHLSGRHRALLQAAGESARSLLRIVDDTLDFSKIEAGKLSIAWQSFDIHRSIGEAVAAELPYASRKGLWLDTRIEAGVAGTLKGDDRRLQQLLGYLIRRALKSSSEGGVRIEAYATHGTREWQDIEINIADTGNEIDAGHLNSLFDPFAHAGGCTRDGLELAIIHRLCRLMDLSIRFQSEPIRGVRAVLCGRFAVVGQEEHKVISAAPESAALGQGEAARILVAEDHAIVREVLRQQLTALGWSCDLVADGEEALTALAARPYALLITDCYMPKMDGLELARRIRASETDARLPIVALTANVMADQLERCKQVGMDDVISKPVRLATLVERLGSWLGATAEPARQVTDSTHTGVADSDVAQVSACLSRVFGDGNTDGLKEYIEITEFELGRLNAALRVMDADKLREIAHSVRGIAAFFGANQLAEVASSVEADQSASDRLMHARRLESGLNEFANALKQAWQIPS